MPSTEINSCSLAVIGAGISGLFAAKFLADYGIDVQVYEKSRGTGGRMATRRIGDLEFDIGAQYFTARDDCFQQYINSWINKALVKEWKGRIVKINRQEKQKTESSPTRYVGVPYMTTVSRYLACDLKIAFNTRITRAIYNGSAWQLTAETGEELSLHKIVIIAIPPTQAVPLLEEVPNLASKADSIACHACWTVMAAFKQRLPLSFDGVFINSPTLAWAARNSSKPGRPKSESWVIHASAEWSESHIEDNSDNVALELLTNFFSITDIKIQEPIFLKAHRWRYAKANVPMTIGCLWDPELKIGACGDWCANSRVEGAALSGMAMASQIINSI